MVFDRFARPSCGLRRLWPRPADPPRPAGAAPCLAPFSDMCHRCDARAMAALSWHVPGDFLLVVAQQPWGVARILCVPADRSSTNGTPRNEVAMSVEHGVTEAAVRIRTPRVTWIPLLVAALVILAMRALEWVVPAGPSPGGSWSTGDNGPIVVGALFVVESLLIRSLRGGPDPGIRECSRIPPPPRPLEPDSSGVVLPANGRRPGSPGSGGR